MKNNSTVEEVINEFNYKDFVLYDNTIEIHYDANMAFDIKSIKRLVKVIVKSKGVLFFIKEDRFGRKFMVCKNNDIFTYLKLYIKSGIAKELANRFPFHRFNPYVELYIKNITADNASVPNTYLYLIPNNINYTSNVVKCVEVFNQFIDNIRNEADSQKFKAALQNYNSVPNDNYKSLTGYINKLFRKFPRLLVTRIDFHYRKDVDSHYLTDIERNEKYWQAKQDLEHFLNNRRSNKLFKHQVGYAWKLEHAPTTGFHYHLFFFFNEKKVHDDINLAKRLGEYWVKITQGRGRYFNCNAKKDKYKFLGIGKIHRNDVKARENLKKAAEYVTKTDSYNARVVALEENGRVFDRGR